MHVSHYMKDYDEGDEGEELNPVLEQEIQRVEEVFGSNSIETRYSTDHCLIATAYTLVIEKASSDMYIYIYILYIYINIYYIYI